MSTKTILAPTRRSSLAFASASDRRRLTSPDALRSQLNEIDRALGIHEAKKKAAAD